MIKPVTHLLLWGLLILTACTTKSRDGLTDSITAVDQTQPKAESDIALSVQGHRGARALFPENTLHSFEYAILHGADQIEFDIQYTKDNDLVVTHDPYISSEICLNSDGSPLSEEKIYIRTLTLEQVQSYDCGSLRKNGMPRYLIPGAIVSTLDQFLNFVLVSDHPAAKNIIFKFDLKSDPKLPQYFPTPETIAQLVAQKVQAYGIQDRSVFSSFDIRVLQALKFIDAKFKTALLWDSILTPQVLELAKQLKIDTFSPHYLVLLFQAPKKWTHQFQSAGIKMVPYTVNKVAHWEKLINSGLYGIITDDPAGLKEFFESNQNRLHHPTQEQINAEIERDPMPYIEKGLTVSQILVEFEKVIDAE